MFNQEEYLTIEQVTYYYSEVLYAGPNKIELRVFKGYGGSHIADFTVLPESNRYSKQVVDKHVSQDELQYYMSRVANSIFEYYSHEKEKGSTDYHGAEKVVYFIDAVNKSYYSRYLKRIKYIIDAANAESNS